MASFSRAGDQSPSSISTFNERRIDRAYDHVCKFWFPPDPELLERIQAGFASDAYQDNTEVLIEELKSDLALLTYCIRELSTSGSERNGAVDYSPIELIRQASLERLREILSVEPSQVSLHSIASTQSLQNSQLRSAIISTTTTELLAGSTEDIDPEFGFSSALLRTLGITLIAWNYTEVFENALTALTSDTKLDDQLTRILGFSPIALGIQIAKRWGLSVDLRATLGDTTAVDADLAASDRARIEHLSSQVQRLCDIGEALARASDPERYPSAQSDWNFAERELEERLGPQGIEVVKKAVRRQCAHYFEAMPNVFSSFSEFDPRVEIEKYRSQSVTEWNPDVEACPEEAQRMFRKLHSQLSPDNISRENLRLLVKEIIPKTGFVCGCIYLIDPGTFALVPRVTIGSFDLNSVDTIDYSSLKSVADPVGAAYQTGTTRVERNVERRGRKVTIYTAGFGDLDRAGALYLEAPPEDQGNYATRFKAIRTALMACLQVK